MFYFAPSFTDWTILICVINIYSFKGLIIGNGKRCNKDQTVVILRVDIKKFRKQQTDCIYGMCKPKVLKTKVDVTHAQ